MRVGMVLNDRILPDLILGGHVFPVDEAPEDQLPLVLRVREVAVHQHPLALTVLLQKQTSLSLTSYLYSQSNPSSDTDPDHGMCDLNYFLIQIYF